MRLLWWSCNAPVLSHCGRERPSCSAGCSAVSYAALCVAILGGSWAPMDQTRASVEQGKHPSCGSWDMGTAAGPWGRSWWSLPCARCLRHGSRTTLDGWKMSSKFWRNLLLSHKSCNHVQVGRDCWLQMMSLVWRTHSWMLALSAHVCCDLSDCRFASIPSRLRF